MPIQATPRNKLLGLLADGIQGVNDFARKPFGYDNPPAGLLMDALSVPAVAATVDRLSYGEPLTTGKGFTRQMRPETSEAALAVVPAVAKYPKQAALVATGLLGDAGAAKAMFIGASAKTWDAAKAAKAAKMEKAGEDARKIWSETGTFKGVDGKWRQEIDDSGSRIKSDPLPMREINGKNYADFKVGDALSHDELFAAYPDVASIEQSFSSGTGYAGNYKPAADWISLSDKYQKPVPSQYDTQAIQGSLQAIRDFEARPRVARYDGLLNAIADKHGFGPKMDSVINKFGSDIERERDSLSKALVSAKKDADSRPVGLLVSPDARSTQLHEIQHAIQEREGFARGGNPEMMKIDIGYGRPDPAFIKGLQNWNNVLGDNGFPADKMFQPADVRHNNPENLWGWLEDQGGWLSDKLGRDPYEFEKSFGSVRSAADIMLTDPVEAYRRLAGEAEARATQARMNMTQAERLAKFPFDSYDVPVDSLLLGP